MSDDEDQVMSEEEREESEEEDSRMGPPDSGPSEAERAMQRRREQVSTSDLDEAVQEMLEANREERRALEDEIQEMRARSERRKRERAEEEAQIAKQRQEEDSRQKAAEEERKRKKEEEEAERKAARAQKMAEFEKYKNPPKPNFVIQKRADGGIAENDEDSKDTERKSKEQLEAERRAILQQRITPLEISGFDEGKLKDKAKELHKDIYRLEAEKYDLEKRFKEQQYDMMELAERARQMNKVGKGGLKRVQLGPDEVDKIQDRFAGAPAKIEMYSKYERQKDKRVYSERQTIFKGPQYAFQAERIAPTKAVAWDELTGTLMYDESGMPAAPAEEAPAEEAAAEGEE